MFKCEIIGTQRVNWKFDDGRTFDGYRVYLAGHDPTEVTVDGKETFAPAWSLEVISGLNLSPGQVIDVEWNRYRKLVPIK